MKIISTENLDINDILKYFNDVVVIPTETVYGLAAPINNEKILMKIFKLKNRPCDNPLIVHVSDLDMLKTVIDGEIPKNYDKIIKKFWPGPISLLFKANKKLSKIVTAGLDTVLVRIPDNETIIKIIKTLNIPLAAPSANLSGNPSPSTIQHTIDDFNDKISLYIDGGKCKIGLESTVFSYLNDNPILLRPGAICRQKLEEIINKKIEIRYNQKNLNTDIISPGQKYKHYSPKNKFILIYNDYSDITDLILNFSNFDKKIKIGILKHQNVIINISKIKNIEIFELGNNLTEIANNLYNGLRYLDVRCNIIFTCNVEDFMEGEAIMDRLKKSAHFIYKK